MTELCKPFDGKMVKTIEVVKSDFAGAVSYTHLTLPTNSRV